MPEQPDLISVPISMQKQLMFVSFEPPQNPRRRYGREGKRRIKKIESSPMIINVCFFYFPRSKSILFFQLQN